ncbi:hypothetical protein ACFV3F_03525 [Streptomyces sp. NPDC059717]|uniref:hypothetical protein n=1 Tax=Streptomyces sp. NPDC059717 TaxID=3346922 RepID=UPI00367BDBFC
MQKRTLARHRLDGTGWAHPYGHGPLSPVLYADGGDGGGGGDSGSDGTGGIGDGGTGGAGTGGQPAGGVGGSATPWEGFQWDGKVDSLPADVAKVIRDAREEAGKARTVAKQNAADEARRDLLATISKAVGLDGGDKPPTAEELTQQLATSKGRLTTAQEDALSARIELSVWQTAHRLGANADALLDSRAFVDSIDGLQVDPTDRAAFTAAVQAKVNEAMQANPALRASKGPGRSGGDLGGGTGDQAPTLDQQIAQAQADGNWRLVMQLQNSKLPGLAAQQQ